MVRKFFSLVKISHTVFALPFALVGFFLGFQDVSGGFPWKLLALVLVCMVTARNSAMAFNRWADQEFDAQNPRTKSRELPSGILSRKSVVWFIALNVVLFVTATYFINTWCFILSPVALAVILGYSYMKRITPLSHFVLGTGLGLAPVGAYLAVTGHFATWPVLLGMVVLLWVSGFDIIYALQDEEIDKSLQLKSLPAWLGKDKALGYARLIHLLSATILMITGYFMVRVYPSLFLLFWFGVCLFIFMLIYQHRIINKYGLDKVNLAFFTFNGIASVVFGTLVILDFYI
ncbi:MAG: putative 4-hydroxybenzoate polyprenyltransferase [Saprospiraceae bacterium]|nr:putative 4-hydroxybenzoate polyprenyltransferase [Saprospiraceae bacterium]